MQNRLSLVEEVERSAFSHQKLFATSPRVGVQRVCARVTASFYFYSCGHDFIMLAAAPSRYWLDFIKLITC